MSVCLYFKSVQFPDLSVDLSSVPLSVLFVPFAVSCLYRYLSIKFFCLKKTFGQYLVTERIVVGGVEG